MIRGLYTAAAGMLVQQTNQDVVANNLANADTTAFKKDRVLVRSFPEMLIHRLADFSPPGPGFKNSPPLLGRLGTGAVVDGIWTDPAYQGVRVTGRPLDVALTGEGYFVVNTPEGERYTRKGDFTIRADNVLATPEGYAVQGQAGDIVLPPETGCHIDPAGRVWAGEREIDSLRLVAFDPAGQEAALTKQGDSLYRLADQAGGGPGGAAARELAPAEGRVQPEALEAANVNIVQEMTAMIVLARAYEANQKAVQAMDGTLEKACNDLGRV
ncbi:MAG: flagellar hook-basal body protein [Heliobacteriaceae bacterium]|nr:flagellar hook-basal body protein [Heliobacteriaceae bacterium]